MAFFTFVLQEKKKTNHDTIRRQDVMTKKQFDDSIISGMSKVRAEVFTFQIKSRLQYPFQEKKIVAMNRRKANRDKRTSPGEQTMTKGVFFLKTRWKLDLQFSSDRSRC